MLSNVPAVCAVAINFVGLGAYAQKGFVAYSYLAKMKVALCDRNSVFGFPVHYTINAFYCIVGIALGFNWFKAVFIYSSSYDYDLGTCVFGKNCAAAAASLFCGDSD